MDLPTLQDLMTDFINSESIRLEEETVELDQANLKLVQKIQKIKDSQKPNIMQNVTHYSVNYDLEPMVSDSAEVMESAVNEEINVPPKSKDAIKMLTLEDVRGDSYFDLAEELANVQEQINSLQKLTSEKNAQITDATQVYTEKTNENLALIDSMEKALKSCSLMTDQGDVLPDENTPDENFHQVEPNAGNTLRKFLK